MDFRQLRVPHCLKVVGRWIISTAVVLGMVLGILHLWELLDRAQ